MIGMPSVYKWFTIGAVSLSLIGGAGFYGYTKGKAKADIVIAQFEKEKSKLKAEYEVKFGEDKTKIVVQYVDRWHVIEKKEKEYVEVAKNDVPSQHDLSRGWVLTHNASAGLSEIDSTAASDGSPSGIRDNQALATIVSNYSKCHQNAEQLKSLQSLITKHNETIDELNKKKK